MANFEDTSIKQQLIILLDVLRAYLAWQKGEADQALRFVHRAMENIQENDPIIHAQLLNLEGLAYRLQLKLPEAIQSFEAALRLWQSMAGLIHRHGQLQSGFNTVFARTAAANLFQLSKHSEAGE